MHKFFLSVILLSLCCLPALLAQTTQESLSLEEMTAVALKNNPDYKNSGLLIEKSIYARKTVWDPGQTTFDWSHGQINSLLDDDHFLIMQEFGSPFSHASLSRLRNSETEYYKRMKEKTGREIRRDLAVTYNEWVYYSTIEKITAETLKFLERAAEYSGLQYQTGESNLLSKLLMETKYLDLASYKKSLENRKFGYQNELMKITFSEKPIIPSDTILVLRNDSGILSSKDTLSATSPDVVVLEQLVKIADNHISFQRAGLTPDLKAGYFNQKIDHVTGFDGWQIGIGVPLWFFPQKSRIQMAKVDRSIAENQYRMQLSSAEYELMTLFNTLQLLNERIEFFRNRILTNADVIENNASEMYESGEIGYIEYIQNIITANQSREDYWMLVRDHNKVIYQIEYYMYE